MQQNKNSSQLWWDFRNPINTGVTIPMTLGCTGSTYAPGGNLGVVPVHDLRYVSWSLRSQQVVTLRLQGGNDPGSLIDWITFVYPGAGVWTTPFDLPAPYQNNTGRLVLTFAFIKFTIQNASGVQTVPFAFMARAWKE